MSRQNEENRENMERIRVAASQLSEFFDSVIIFGTWKGDGDKGTFHFASEEGNLIAVYGHVKRWLIRHEQKIKSQTDIEEWDVYENEEDKDTGDEED